MGHNVNLPFSFHIVYAWYPLQNVPFPSIGAHPIPLLSPTIVFNPIKIGSSFKTLCGLSLTLFRSLWHGLYHLGRSYWLASSKCFCVMGPEAFGLLCMPGWFLTTTCCTLGYWLLRSTLFTDIYKGWVYVFLKKSSLHC